MNDKSINLSIPFLDYCLKFLKNCENQTKYNKVTYPTNYRFQLSIIS